MQNTTNAAVELFGDSQLDWIYLDATHTYAEARNDLERWYPKVSQLSQAVVGGRRGSPNTRVGLARLLSLTALLTTLLKVRRGGLISGHDYQFQSQAMGRRATLRVPCEWCHSKPTGRLGRGASGLGAPEELAPRRSEHNGRDVALPAGGLCPRMLRIMSLWA